MTGQGQRIEDLVDGARVVFIDAIRTDVPSGGNTATRGLIASLAPICALRLVALTPRDGIAVPALARAAFLIESFPAPLLIMLARRYRAVWLEFFLRLSLVYLLRCIWVRAVHRPQYVFFNHHATFLYTLAFFGCKRILVWHDVPSFKRDGTQATRRAAARCVGFERCFIARADYHVTFSFDDLTSLRRLHGCHAFVIPVVPNRTRARTPQAHRSGVLLIGNWTRVENSEGAAAFLGAYAQQQSAPGARAVAAIHIAGHGAAEFVAQARAGSAPVRGLPLTVTPRYGEMADFSELVLLAPVLRGAGIKLKTIEAWSCGLPVIGTAQAFTGLPASIWKRGGHVVGSPDVMARLCHDVAALEDICNALDGAKAFEMYHAAIAEKARTASATLTEKH